MRIRNVEIKFSQIICLALYYSIARHLPHSGFYIGGRLFKLIRYALVKHIFKKCGTNVNIEHGASFGSGINIEIGNNSGIGIHADIPGNTIIGNDVMMGPNCYIAYNNHCTEIIEIPMNKQGMTIPKQTIIGDNVWIGKNVSMTPGRKIANGTIIALGCVLCKDFPENSVVGGNPSKLIKSRKS